MGKELTERQFHLLVSADLARCEKLILEELARAGLKTRLRHESSIIDGIEVPTIFYSATRAEQFAQRVLCRKNPTRPLLVAARATLLLKRLRRVVDWGSPTWEDMHGLMRVCMAFPTKGAKDAALIESGSARRVAGGKRTAEIRRTESAGLKSKVHGEALRLLATKSPRNIPSKIMEILGISRPTVLKYLRTHPSGKWNTAENKEK